MISFEQGEKFSNEKKCCGFYEVSAKEETNINKMLFGAIAELPCIQSYTSQRTTKEEIIHDLAVENNGGNTEMITEGQGSKAGNGVGFAADSRIPNPSVDEPQQETGRIGEKLSENKQENKKKKHKCNC